MTTRPHAQFDRLTLDDLIIEDEESFRHIALYADLKSVVRKDNYSFRTLPKNGVKSWDRAVFLNLAFWGAAEGGDILIDEVIPADVITHVAWHHLAAKVFAISAKPRVDALFLGESIASAFDVYLIGRVIGHSPDSSFIASQVEAMAAATENASLSEKDFNNLLESIAENPERAFASLQALLFDTTSALFHCTDAESALAVLDECATHEFGPLLHHYELANWVLYAKAYGDATPDAKVRETAKALREAADAVKWLTDAWVKPSLA